MGTMASFIGYTFTLTFAVSPLSLFVLHYADIGFMQSDLLLVQVQGLVNTFGDLRGAFAAVERINSILSGTEIDEALAYGLEREIHQNEVHEENIKLFISNGSIEKTEHLNAHYMSALKSARNVGSLAWSGDVCLEGILMQSVHCL